VPSDNTCDHVCEEPGECGLDLPPKRWTGLGRHTLSESWAEVAQGRMQAVGIVEALDILEEVSAGGAPLSPTREVGGAIV
jgi:hypothetical protein